MVCLVAIRESHPESRQKLWSLLHYFRFSKLFIYLGMVFYTRSRATKLLWMRKAVNTQRRSATLKLYGFVYCTKPFQRIDYFVFFFVCLKNVGTFYQFLSNRILNVSDLEHFIRKDYLFYLKCIGLKEINEKQCLQIWFTFYDKILYNK